MVPFSLEALRRGRRIRLVTLSVTVGTTVLFSGLLCWGSHPHALVTLLAGLVGIPYAMSFEYFYHRYIQHWLGSERHQRHHDTFGDESEPAHTNFASPEIAAALIIVHGVILGYADALLVLGFSGPVVAVLGSYLAVFEELHWRIHIGRLPDFLYSLHTRHFQHHLNSEVNFSVLGWGLDELLGTRQKSLRK